MPRRTLWTLGAVVLVLHLWALLALSLPVARGGAQPGRALYTRMLAAPPAPAAPREEPAERRPPAAAHRPVQRRAAPVRKRPPSTGTAAPAQATTAAVPPPTQAAAADYERWLADLAQEDHPSAPEHARPAEAPPAPQPSDANAPAHEGDPPPPPAAAHAAAPEKPAPLALPPPTQLSFEVSGHVKGFDYHARGELAWQTDGERYRVRQSISMLFLGSRAQQSEGRVTARGLQPERFTDEARQERRAQLDFGTHRVQFSDGATATADIGDEAQDRLSVFIQLGALIAAAPERYPPGTKIAFETVGVRRVDRWTFQVRGLERLPLPAGETPALRLQRLPQAGDDQTDDLWLGTELHYLPVRIRLSQGGGDHVDLQLRSHETP